MKQTPKSKTLNNRKNEIKKNSQSHNVSDSFINRKPSLKLQSDTSFPPIGTPTSHRTPQRKYPEHRSSKTPECFQAVNVETPQKNSKISKLDVAVRIRPITIRELNTPGCTDIIRIRGNSLMVQSQCGNDPTSEICHSFHYDHILWSCDPKHENHATQEKVYDSVGRPLINEAFEGYNACLFAYGQTGSGKSYSMMGDELNGLGSLNKNAGIIPRFCKDLFDQIITLDPLFTVNIEVSYFEIYNEKIHDLLVTEDRGTPLRVREHPIWGPYVVDLSVHPVNSYPALYSWIMAGNKQRTTASTLMNDKSSRSHSIFSVVLSLIAPKDRTDLISRRSKINFVDLAGSERVGSMASSEERLRQGININRSLLALGKVIVALSDPKRATTHIPYRESVLTWLLRESLGGNSRTCMLATVTPASCHVEETLSTLRYASQARNIVNRVRINEDPNDRLIRELRAEVESLRALRQEYQKQTLEKSLNTTVENYDQSFADADADDAEHECIIENYHGRLHIVVNDVKHNEVIIEDNLYLKHRDKLVITGGSTIHVEKRELCLDTDDEDVEQENDQNVTNIQNSTINIDDLDMSIAALEHYCEELEQKSKICSTPDTPNDISIFRSNTNFLEELENILSLSHSPTKTVLATPQNKTILNSSVQKKSARKQDKDSVFKYIVQLQDSCCAIEKFANSDEIVKTVRDLNDAIQRVSNAFRSRKSNKSVKFLCDN